MVIMVVVLARCCRLTIVCVNRLRVIAGTAGKIHNFREVALTVTLRLILVIDALLIVVQR